MCIPYLIVIYCNFSLQGRNNASFHSLKLFALYSSSSACFSPIPPRSFSQYYCGGWPWNYHIIFQSGVVLPFGRWALNSFPPSPHLFPLITGLRILAHSGQLSPSRDRFWVLELPRILIVLRPRSTSTLFTSPNFASPRKLLFLFLYFRTGGPSAAPQTTWVSRYIF